MSTVTIEQAIEANRRVYHTRTLWSDEWTCVCEVVDLLKKVRGVQMAFASRYVVVVVRANAFTWEEVEPAVLAIIGGDLPEV